MATSIQDRLLTAAAAYAPLTALLGTSPFRWYFDTLQQGSAFPAVVVEQISGSKTYAATKRLATGFSRYQFTIWGGQYLAGSQARDAVASALNDFMDQWSGGSGISGLSLYSNLNVMERERLFPWTDTPIYQKIVDYRIFADDTL